MNSAAPDDGADEVLVQRVHALEELAIAHCERSLLLLLLLLRGYRCRVELARDLVDRVRERHPFRACVRASGPVRLRAGAGRKVRLRKWTGGDRRTGS